MTIFVTRTFVRSEVINAGRQLFFCIHKVFPLNQLVMNECCPYLLTGGGKLTGLKTYRQLPGFYSRQLYVRHPFSFFHIARFPAVCGEVTHLADKEIWR
ncbi:MAG: hypothetical protein HUK27_14345 [Shigella flexneri]|nr:hypothetical protein [Shigella flexneri]